MKNNKPTTSNKQSNPRRQQAIFTRAHLIQLARQLATTMPTNRDATGEARANYKQWKRQLAATVAMLATDNPNFKASYFTAAIASYWMDAQDIAEQIVQDQTELDTGNATGNTGKLSNWMQADKHNEMQTGERESDSMQSNCNKPTTNNNVIPFGTRN